MALQPTTNLGLSRRPGRFIRRVSLFDTLTIGAEGRLERHAQDGGDKLQWGYPPNYAPNRSATDSNFVRWRALAVGQEFIARALAIYEVHPLSLVKMPEELELRLKALRIEDQKRIVRAMAEDREAYRRHGEPCRAGEDYVFQLAFNNRVVVEQPLANLANRVWRFHGAPPPLLTDDMDIDGRLIKVGYGALTEPVKLRVHLLGWRSEPNP